MRIQKSWVYKLRHLYMPLDEDSFKFKNELKRLDFEQKQTTPIAYNPYLFHSFAPNLVREQIKPCYFFIDTRIYKATKDSLRQAGIESALDGICSLLKQAYYKNILININAGNKKNRREFELFFKTLLHLFEHKDTAPKATSIKIKLDNNKWITSSDAGLVNEILVSFMEKISKDSFTATLLTDLEEKSDIFNNLPAAPNKKDLVSNAGKKVFSSALMDEVIFNLVLYIQTRTDYKHNAGIDLISKNMGFTDELLELVYYLIEELKLIDFSEDITERAFVRSRLTRYIKEHKKLLALFDNKKTAEILNFEATFPDIDYINKVIANKNRLKLLNFR